MYQRETLKISYASLVKTSKIPSSLKLAQSPEVMARIDAFREQVFNPLYPELDKPEWDRHDSHAIHLYTENNEGMITSTVRMVFDSEAGLPADDYAHEAVNQLRAQGLKLLEISRFAISEEARQGGILNSYYRAFYDLSVENQVDSAVIVINQKNVNFHQNRIGARVLMTIDHIAGSPFQFACLEWRMSQTKTKFLHWIGISEAANDATYSMECWNQYSRMFASVYTHVQRELYQEAAHYLVGNVVDLGAGPARLAPLLADKANVTHYTAVEYAHDMVEIAKFTLHKLHKPTFRVLEQKVEEITEYYSSAVSLQSLYAWENPASTLKHIYQHLTPNALFILANPNEYFDHGVLFAEAEKELMWHPDFEAFKAYNAQLAANPSAKFLSMSQLIDLLRAARFEIVSCHSQHYRGMVNFVVAKKPNK